MPRRESILTHFDTQCYTSVNTTKEWNCNGYPGVSHLQHQYDNTAGANGSSKRRKQVYWGKTRINQLLFTKYNYGHKQHNRFWPTKMTITSRDDQQQFKQLHPARTIWTAKGNNNQQHFILHRYLLVGFLVLSSFAYPWIPGKNCSNPGIPGFPGKFYFFNETDRIQHIR